MRRQLLDNWASHAPSWEGMRLEMARVVDRLEKEGGLSKHYQTLVAATRSHITQAERTASMAEDTLRRDLIAASKKLPDVSSEPLLVAEAMVLASYAAEVVSVPGTILVSGLWGALLGHLSKIQNEFAQGGMQGLSLFRSLDAVLDQEDAEGLKPVWVNPVKVPPAKADQDTEEDYQRAIQTKLEMLKEQAVAIERNLAVFQRMRTENTAEQQRLHDAAAARFVAQ